jgi:hypothetical protein
VYEIPKEKLQELHQRGELDAAALEAAQIEDYRRTYVEQPIQNVLALVGRTEGVGQRSRPVADYAVVLGDPGSGKSTLLQYIALQWVEQPIRDLKELAQRPLPLLIELRKYARDRHDQKCSSIVEYLHQGDIACRLNQQRLHEVLTAGDAVALFDGVDEVFDPNLRDVVVTDIHRFTNNYPQVQVVVTSRWLGYKAQTLRDAGFQHYMLQDLTDEQIAEFIQRWHDQTFPEGADKVRKRERLHQAIRESKAIRELAGNPLLLTMMAILNRHQELPRDRPELYNQASRVLLHQWDVERNLIEQKLDPVTIDYRDKQAMLRQVAFHMQSGEAGLAGNIISAQDLEGILTEYLKSIDIDQPRDVARRMIRQLRERNFILCYLGADNYAFVHRTFLEFFAAWAFVWEFKETQTLTFEELRDQTFGAHCQEESWQEVLHLVAVMLDSSFLERIIEYLLSQTSEGKDLIEKNRLLNILLAGECYIETRGKVSLDTRKTLNLKLKKLVGLFFKKTEGSLTITNFRISNRAIYCLAKAFREEPGTLEFLMNLVELNSRKVGVERTIAESALEAIVENYRGSTEVFFWLTKAFSEKTKKFFLYHPVLFEKGAYEYVVICIARGWKSNPETLPWLQSLAQKNENSSIRYVAVRELEEGWRDDPDMLEFWDDLILNDKFESEYNFHGNTRQTALNVLVQQYPDHPKTLELLQDRTQNDNDEQLRDWAAKQIEQLKMQNKNTKMRVL